MSDLTESKLNAWYLIALEKRQVIFPHLTEYADKGYINNLQNELNFFKMDLLVDMLILMEKDGHKHHFNNVTYKFERKINEKLDSYEKALFIKAKQVKLKRQKEFLKKL